MRKSRKEAGTTMGAGFRKIAGNPRDHFFTSADDMSNVIMKPFVPLNS